MRNDKQRRRRTGNELYMVIPGKMNVYWTAGVGTERRSPLEDVSFLKGSGEKPPYSQQFTIEQVVCVEIKGTRSLEFLPSFSLRCSVPRLQYFQKERNRRW